MRNTKSWVVAATVVLGGAYFAVAQMPPTPPRPGAGGDPQKAYLEGLRKQSPELYKFMKRLGEIREETEKIIESFAKKEIDKETAKAKLVTLVTEEQDIMKSPEFLVEQRLLGASMRGAPPAMPPGMPPPPKR